MDVPMHPAYRTRPYLQKDKERWLTYHDRSTGDLYGMLPLAVGMPVILLDHIDRSREKKIAERKNGSNFVVGTASR